MELKKIKDEPISSDAEPDFSSLAPAPAMALASAPAPAPTPAPYLNPKVEEEEEEEKKEDKANETAKAKEKEKKAKKEEDAAAAAAAAAATAAAAAAAADDDDDPIVASYPVFLNPALLPPRRLLILQQPNRIVNPTAAAGPPPTELRIKPVSGMVELDVPIDLHAEQYDRERGVGWGRAVHQATAGRGVAGASMGLAGGFGVNAAPLAKPGGQGAAAGASAGARRRRNVEGAAANEVADDAVLDWDDAVRLDRVLRTHTLGGQAPVSDEVQYMVGVFHNQSLHLTPVSSLVQLRPQLHHIDSAALVDRTAAAAAAAAAAKSSDANGAAASGAGPGAGPGPGPASHAIHMSIKSSDESGETVKTETVPERLHNVQIEPWRRTKYTDENDEAAWDVYNDNFFFPGHGPTSASAVAAELSRSKAATAPRPDPDNVSRLERAWDDEKLLRAISGMKKGRTGHGDGGE